MIDADIIKQIENFYQEYCPIYNAHKELITKQLDNFYKEYNSWIVNKCEVITNSLDACYKELYAILKTECAGMQEWIKSKYEPPELNFMEVFRISRKEEIYTRFLEWLLNPKSNHNLKTLPLDYFLKKIVNNNFPFNLNKEVEVKAEKILENGTIDLKIKGENFACYIENKILSVEGKDQTPRYYESVIQKETVYHCPFKGTPNKDKCPNKLFNKCPTKDGNFFIYLTICKCKKGPKCRKFDNKIWSQIIDDVLKKLLELKDAKESIKTIIKTVIYNLQGNENPKVFKYFDSLESGKYDKNLLTQYVALKELKEEDEKLEKNI